MDGCGRTPGWVPRPTCPYHRDRKQRGARAIGRVETVHRTRTMHPRAYPWEPVIGTNDRLADVR